MTLLHPLQSQCEALHNATLNTNDPEMTRKIKSGRENIAQVVKKLIFQHWGTSASLLNGLECWKIISHHPNSTVSLNTLGKAKASDFKLQLAWFLSWESLLKLSIIVPILFPTSRPIHDFDEHVNQRASSNVVSDRHVVLRKGKSGKRWHLMTRRILTGPHRGADRRRRHRSPRLCACRFQNCLCATKGLPDLTLDHDRIREAWLKRLLWWTRFHENFPRGARFHLWTLSYKVRGREKGTGTSAFSPFAPLNWPNIKQAESDTWPDSQTQKTSSVCTSFNPFAKHNSH